MYALSTEGLARAEELRSQVSGSSKCASSWTGAKNLLWCNLGPRVSIQPLEPALVDIRHAVKDGFEEPNKYGPAIVRNSTGAGRRRVLMLQQLLSYDQ